MNPLYGELAERFRGEVLELWPRLRAALLAFADFLAYLAGQT